MHRRRFLQALTAALLSPSLVSRGLASGPDVPSYIKIDDSRDVIDHFEEEQLKVHDGDAWSWALTRYIHKETAERCSEELGLDIPPYALYIYHLNAGRMLDLKPATEKEGTCVSAGFDYKVASIDTDCLVEIDRLGSEPEITEVGERAKSLFQDQLEEDLPISSGEWEFGLKVPGLILDQEWQYTKSDRDLIDKRTFTAEIDSEEREQIDNQFASRNNLDVRCFLTTEQTSRTGHYIAIIGVVPDSDSIDTEGFLTEPVEFSPEESRNNIRTLMKSAFA